MAWQDHKPEATDFYIFKSFFNRLLPIKGWAIESLNAQLGINACGSCLVVNERGIVYANQKKSFRDKDKWIHIGIIDLSKIVPDDEMTMEKL